MKILEGIELEWKEDNMKFLEEKSIRKKFEDVKRYATYFGYDGYEKLENFDMVILEPQGQNKQTIINLKAKGVITIAYVSVMEIHKTNPHFSLLKDEDLLKINDKLVINEKYDTLLTDISSDGWRSMLIHKVCNLILNEGYDGVFLDTIGDIEYECIPRELRNTLIAGAVNFIVSIRKYCEDCIIIQNNGLNYLYCYTSDLIDGICWENPEFKAFNSSEWNEQIFKNLTLLKEKKGIKVFILIENTNDINGYEENTYGINLAMEKFLKTVDATVYIAPTNYLSLD